MTDRFLRADIASAVEGGDALTWAESVSDTAPPEAVFRNKEGRRTLRFDFQNRSYFLKLHSGVGWVEIIKNLVALRAPVVSAINEYRAVRALESIDVDTLSVAAFEVRGASPASRRSMLVTDDLVGTVSLEHYCAPWAEQPPAFALRVKLIRVLADISRRMHGAGINHRDYYLCHFHLDLSTLDHPQPRCHVIDLHRAQCRASVPRRWLIKDLAGLYFSAMDCGLTQRDLLRFLRHYEAGGLRKALQQDAAFWGEVVSRAQKLYRREHGCEPPTPNEASS